MRRHLFLALWAITGCVGTTPSEGDVATDAVLAPIIGSNGKMVFRTSKHDRIDRRGDTRRLDEKSIEEARAEIAKMRERSERWVLTEPRNDQEAAFLHAAVGDWLVQLTKPFQLPWLNEVRSYRFTLIDHGEEMFELLLTDQSGWFVHETNFALQPGQRISDGEYSLYLRGFHEGKLPGEHISNDAQGPIIQPEYYHKIEGATGFFLERDGIPLHNPIVARVGIFLELLVNHSNPVWIPGFAFRSSAIYRPHGRWLWAQPDGTTWTVDFWNEKGNPFAHFQVQVGGIKEMGVIGRNFDNEWIVIDAGENAHLLPGGTHIYFGKDAAFWETDSQRGSALLIDATVP